MRGIWSSKFIFWNFVALFLLKSVSAPSIQLAQLVLGEQAFPPQEIITQTNVFRVEQGLGVLQENSALNAAAAQKLEDMMRNQYFAHFSPAGISPWYWFQVNGYRYTYAGENLAIGFPDAKTTLDAWIKSPSHRNNLTNAQFREIGVAVAFATIAGDSGILVVQLFGSPLNVPRVAVSSGDAKSPVSLGLSRSDADETTPTPTPKITLSPSPLKIARTTPIPSTLITPRATSIDKASTLSRVMRILNNTFTFYAYLLVLASLGYLLFREFRKEYIIKTAFHALLFALAVIVPLITIIQQSRIG
ncbi:MAG: CAP domain-containing protein [Patescibacteria group bacterium]